MGPGKLRDRDSGWVGGMGHIPAQNRDLGGWRGTMVAGPAQRTFSPQGWVGEMGPPAQDRSWSWEGPIWPGKPSFHGQGGTLGCPLGILGPPEARVSAGGMGPPEAIDRARKCQR